MGGPGSGPRPTNLAEYAKRTIGENLPAIVGSLACRATGGPVECPHCGSHFSSPAGGDREAAIYLIDRLLGRPKIEIDQRITSELRLTADDYALLARAAALEARVIQAAQLPPGEVIDVPARVVAIESESGQTDGPCASQSPLYPHSEAPADTSGTQGTEPPG